MDGSIRVCALEYITSAYQHVYSGFYQSWSSFCLHAAIYLDECLTAALFDDEPETSRTSGRSSVSGRSSLSEGNFKSVRALNAAKRYMETHSSHSASRGTGSSAASVSSSTASSAGSSSCGLQEGMKIEHQRFGRGTVLKIEGTGENTKATVEFVHSGTKQLLLKYAKFTVVD